MTKHSILFLAANPCGTDGGTLEREAQAIQQELERSCHRDSFELVTRWAVEPLDLLRELRKLKPTVVHFSARRGPPVVGDRTRATLADGLYLQGADGRPQWVSAEGLQETFGAAGSSVQVVLLHGCYSAVQAEALLAHVDCVVGAGGAIPDEAARGFAIGFYGGLGERESIATAYRQGCAAIRLVGLPDAECPQLVVRQGTDADRVVLATNALVSLSDMSSAMVKGFARRLEEHAEAHRQDLSTQGLSRVPRAALRDPYTRLSERLRNHSPAMHYLYGDAGCGKSTALGEVFDLAPSLGAQWRLIVPCGSLRVNDDDSAEAIDLKMGVSAGGTGRLTELCARLTTAVGPGVVLIDTLDLIVSVRTAPTLRQVLGSLIAAGGQVIGSCRSEEFRACFASTSLRNQDTWPLGAFERDEMIAAAKLFARRWSRDADGSTFAAALEALTAGEHRLDVIARQPLLLSMLCEIFAPDGHVPSDLTVAALYRGYWRKYIEDSRRHGPDSEITHVKERLCLRVAEILVATTGVCVARTDVVRDASKETEAFKELRTDGVLTVADGGVRFFHQTLLEYAKARWLMTSAGMSACERLLNDLAAEQDELSAGLHEWPVVRQLLAIIGADAYKAMLARLPLARIVAFRNAVLAAGSRLEAGAFEALVPFARSGSDEHRRQLLSSVDLALADQLDGALDAALAVLGAGTKEAAVNAAKTLGRLCLRVDRPARHAAVVVAISNVYPPAKNRTDFLEVLGYFLANLEGTRLSSETLRVLWRSVVDCGMRWADLLAPVGRIMELYLVPGVERAVQLYLLGEVTGNDVKGALTAPVARLVCAALPDSLVGERRELGASLLPVLSRGGPPGWSTVWAKVAGFLMTSDPQALRSTVRELLCGDPTVAGQTLIAVSEAVRLGAAKAVAFELLSVPTENAAVHARKVLVPLLRELAPIMEDDVLGDLRRWAVALGADGALKQTAPPPDTRSDDELIAEACRRDNRTIAREASRTLLARVRETHASQPGRLIELLRSAFIEVRQNAVRSLAYMTPAERCDDELIDRFCSFMRSEADAQVLQCACDVVTAWATRVHDTPGTPDTGARVPTQVGRWLGELSAFEGPNGRLPNALADAILSSLTSLARHEPTGVQPELSAWVSAVVRTIPFDKGDHREKVAEVLLPAAHRHDAGFLETLVSSDVPAANSFSVAMAVVKCLGKQTPLLRRIAEAPWCSAKALNFIQVALGA